VQITATGRFTGSIIINSVFSAIPMQTADRGVWIHRILL